MATTESGDGPRTASEHRQVYDAELQDWSTVAAELSKITVAAMDELGLEVLVQARAKTAASFERKVRRILAEKGQFDYRRGIEDLAAVRIITHDRHDRELALAGFKETIDRIGGSTRTAPSAERVRQLRPWEFAYRSHHLTFQLRPANHPEPFWRVVDGRWIELQVRTVAEHAWAAVDHEYRYKSIAPLTDDATRTLFMLSAQLEAIDFQLDQLRAMLHESLGADGVRMRGGDMDVPPSGTNIQLMLTVSEDIQNLLGSARDSGWGLLEPVKVHVQTGFRGRDGAGATADEHSAAEHEMAAAEQLAQVADALALTTIGELVAACLEAATPDNLAKLARYAEDHHLDMALFPADFLGLSLVANHESLSVNTYPAWAHAIADARSATA